MYRLYHNNTYRCPALIPVYDECCNYYMDRGLHVEGKLFDEVGMVSAAIGDVKMSVRSDDYEGWLVCDGRAVSRTTYADLFALIGTRFGAGNGETTFNLPDARGRVLGSVQQSTDTSYRCVGEEVGKESHALTIGEMPRHNHGVTDPQHAHGITDPQHAHGYVNQIGDQNTDNALATQTAADEADYNQTTSYSSTGITINSSATGISLQLTGGNDESLESGNGLAHNNMQPTLFIGNTFIYCGVKDTRSTCNNSYVVQPCDD